MRPVILCGDSGSRLWPLSKPKQFQKIFSQNTMFHNTLLRLKGDYMPPIITTNIQYESLLMQELHALQECKVVFEPVKIGTAAAILIAVLLCDRNETILYQLSLLMNQIRSIAELFNRGRGKRGNKFTQSALKQNNCIVDFIAQNVLFYI